MTPGNRKSFPEFPGRYTGEAPELFGKIGYILESASGGNVTDVLTGAGQKSFCLLDPLVDDIVCQREAGLSFKKMRQVIRGKIYHRRQRFSGQVFIQMRAYVVFDRGDGSVLIGTAADTFFIQCKGVRDPVAQIRDGGAGPVDRKLRDLLPKEGKRLVIGSIHAAEKDLQKAVVETGQGISCGVAGVLQGI